MLALSQKKRSKYSWTPFYKIVSWILSSSRLNYFSDGFNDKRWKIVFMGMIFSFQMFNAFVCLAGLLLSNDYDFEDVVSCLVIFFTETSICLKALTLITYSASLRKLSDSIMKETNVDDLEHWERELAEKYHKYSKWVCIKVLVLYNLTLVTYIIAPVFSNKDYMMPILMEFPGTNRTSRVGYVINYSLGVYNILYGATVEMGFDIPAFLQACFISYQLDRCIHYCSMIGNFETSYNSHDKQTALIKNCIRLHANIYGEVSIINTSVVALTVITIVPLQTILLFTLLMGTIREALIMMIASGYHLFMYCFLGEIVTNKCVEASNAIYNSQWYRIEKHGDRTAIMFFLTVSKYEMGFSAGGLFKLSLATFTDLTKRVYGACAFLQNVL